ncbi:MAG: LamG domain-containing protein, partial [Planctomycetota bacterium]
MKRQARRSLLPRRGLVAHWPLDERDGTKARDVSGNGHHGTLHGGPAWQPDGGRVDGALRFDGGDQYVDCGKAPGSAAALTVAFWMKPASRHTGAPVDKLALGAGGAGWTLKVRAGGALCFVVGSLAKKRSLAIPSGYSVGMWAHVACTYQNGEAKLYLNGTEKGSRSGIKETTKDAVTSLYMGRPSVTWRGERFTGLLDDVRIYDRSLPAAEVAALYRAGASASGGAGAGRAAGKQPAGPAPGRQETADVPRPDPARRREAIRPLLAEIDSLIGKGDCAAARARVEKAAVDAALTGFTDEIVAAGRVCDSLDARRKAVRVAVENNIDKEIELRTTKGKVLGTVRRVTDEGIDLVIKKKLRGMGTVETRMALKWSDLAPKQEDDLARRGGWRAEGAGGAVALAYVALAREDRAAAGRALADAGDHPLAARVRLRLDAPRREAAARAAWAAIMAKGRAKTLSAPQAKSLLESIAAFEQEYGDTDSAATVAKKLAAVKARAAVALDAGALELGLVGWWRFDEGRGTTARDSSGMSNHGTVTGGARWVRGRLGGALEFDGKDDYVEVGSVGVSGAAPRTIAGWARATTTDFPGWATVFGFSPAVAGHGKYFDIARNNGGKYALHVSGRDYDLCAVDLRWHHLAATYDGSTIARYLDGNLVGSITRALDTVDEVCIGRRASKPRHFPGLVDEVRIYSRALSAAEVAALYRAGASASDAAAPSPKAPDTGPPTVAGSGKGTGLLGTYYSGRDLGRAILRRIDPRV